MVYLADDPEDQGASSNNAVNFDISTVTVVTFVMLESSPSNIHGTSYHDSILRTYLGSG